MAVYFCNLGFSFIACNWINEDTSFLSLKLILVFILKLLLLYTIAIAYELVHYTTNWFRGGGLTGACSCACVHTWCVWVRMCACVCACVRAGAESGCEPIPGNPFGLGPASSERGGCAVTIHYSNTTVCAKTSTWPVKLICNETKILWRKLLRCVIRDFRFKFAFLPIKLDFLTDFYRKGRLQNLSVKDKMLCAHHLN